MKFSPIFIIPQQERNTTPDIFLTDQYGKLPELHGDGPLQINEAVRLSKIINRITPAFKNNNSIIYGFIIENVYLKNDDLYFEIGNGTGIIDKNVFSLKKSTTVVWNNFKNIIPINLQKGQILLYLGYFDSLSNNPDRPYPQNKPYNIVNDYPDDQFDFDPISFNTAFYNAKTKKVVNSIWDKNEKKILISSSIFFERKTTGEVEVWLTESRDSVIVINDDGSEEELEQQQGGFNSIQEVDGGPLSDFELQKPNGINLLINEEIQSKDQIFMLPYEISDTKNLNIFCNGIKYKYPEDVLINGKKISFKNNINPIGGWVYIYQNVISSSYGSLKTIFSEKIINSDIIESSIIYNDEIEKNSNLLVFYNGLLIDSTQYELQKQKIKFLLKIKKETIIEIVKVTESLIYPKNIEIILDSSVRQTSSIVSAFNLNPLKTYLVFYNGVFYNPKIDYTINQNNIIFKKLLLTKDKKILIIGV